MRELSVQAASDATMTPADKEAIQKEITSLKDEIDRMYYYYLDPLYTLQKNMKKEKFETLFQLIREANEILSSQKK